MDNKQHSDLVLASVRIAITLELFAGWLFLSALVIAVALATGPAQFLLGLLLLGTVAAFAASKAHHKEKAHYGLYTGDETQNN